MKHFHQKIYRNEFRWVGCGVARIGSALHNYTFSLLAETSIAAILCGFPEDVLQFVLVVL